jgi:hypothetical protein
MQRHKSPRHVRAANARWRMQKADDERAAGIPDRLPFEDCRQPITLDLTSYGGKRIRIEPRMGYVSCRAVDDDTGRVLHCAAMKTLLHTLADELAPMMSPRRLM